jgi:hypothetical protein
MLMQELIDNKVCGGEDEIDVLSEVSASDSEQCIDELPEDELRPLIPEAQFQSLKSGYLTDKDNYVKKVHVKIKKDPMILASAKIDIIKSQSMSRRFNKMQLVLHKLQTEQTQTYA